MVRRLLESRSALAGQNAGVVLVEGGFILGETGRRDPPLAGARRGERISCRVSAAKEVRRLTRRPRRESDGVPPKRLLPRTSNSIEGYDSIVSELIDLVESARRVLARAVNSIMNATY
jgi:hypothetical protein